MNLVERQLNSNSQHLNSNDIEIIKHINMQYEKIPQMKIKELATVSYTSVTTIHRIIKKLGFEGFSDFRYKIKAEKEKDSLLEFSSEKYFEKTIKDIELTKRLNEREISKVAKIILESNQCYCYGTGWKQRQSVDNFSIDLLYYGRTCTTLRTIDDLRIASDNSDKNTVFLIVSLSGNGEKYVNELKNFSFKDSSVVSVTLDSSNQLTSLADHSLYYKTDTLNNNKKHWNCITLHFLMDYLLESIIKESESTRLDQL